MEILYRNLLSIDVELSSSCLWKSPKYAHKNSSMILVICPRPIRCFASLKSALVDPKPSASKKWPVLAPKDRGFLEMGVPQNGSFIMENPFINWWFTGTPISGNLQLWILGVMRKNPEITQPSLCCTLRESNVAIENPPFRDDVPFTGDIPATFHYQCVYHILYTL